MQKNLDCVFVIDTTGSMDEYILAVQATIKKLMEKIMRETTVESI